MNIIVIIIQLISIIALQIVAFRLSNQNAQLRKDNLLRTPSVGCIAHAVKFAHHVLPNVTV